MEEKENKQEEMVKEALHKAKEEMEKKTEAPEETIEEEQVEEAPKKEKKPKKDKKDLKIEELNDRVMRQMAEFENFRKRTEKEKSQMYEVGAREMVEKILPVVDNFERGLFSLSKEEREEAFPQGMEMIYKQFMEALKSAGVSPIEAVGETFDPNLHNAVMHVEDPEEKENVIVEEFQKGYQYKDTVIRHSMVKVAN